MTQKTYRLVLILISITSLAINTASLYRKQHQSSMSPRAFWDTGTDTKCYFYNSVALKEGRPLITVFKDRLLLPILITATGATHNNPYPYLYAVQGIHFLFPIVIASISMVLFKRYTIALLSAALYAFYTPAKLASQSVATDFTHAFVFASAMLYTLIYLRSDNSKHMVAASVLWMLTMISRPTFIFVSIFMLPIVFLYTTYNKLSFRRAVVFLLLLIVIPIAYTVNNISLYGVPTPTFNGVENIHTVFIPGIKTTIRKQSEIETWSASIWHEERDLKAMLDPDYLSLSFWSSDLPKDKKLYALQLKSLKDFDRRIIINNYPIAISLVFSEMANLSLTSPVFPYFGSRGRFIFTLMAGLGLALLLFSFRQRGPALFISICLGFIVVTSSTFLWSSQRFMLPVDIIFLTLAPSVLMSWRRILLFLSAILIYKAVNCVLFAPLFNYLLTLFITCAVIYIADKSSNKKMERTRNPLRGFRYAHF